MGTNTMITPNFSHRLASPTLRAGNTGDLYDTLNIMLSRIESRLIMMAEYCNDRIVSDSLYSAITDVQDVEAVVRAFCGIEDDGPKGEVKAVTP